MHAPQFFFAKFQKRYVRNIRVYTVNWSQVIVFVLHLHVIVIIFADNVDTRGALDAVRDLIGICNVYIRDKRASNEEANCLLLRDIAGYITWIFRVFGAIPTEDNIGFPITEYKGAANVSTSLIIQSDRIISVLKSDNSSYYLPHFHFLINFLFLFVVKTCQL